MKKNKIKKIYKYFEIAIAVPKHFFHLVTNNLSVNVLNI